MFTQKIRQLSEPTMLCVAEGCHPVPVAEVNAHARKFHQALDDLESVPGTCKVERRSTAITAKSDIRRCSGSEQESHESSMAFTSGNNQRGELETVLCIY